MLPRLRPRFPLVLAAFAVAAAPAYASSGDAPGVLKKQATQPKATVPAVTDPAPANVTAPTTNSKANAQTPTTNAKVPLNKGTAKKLATTQPSGAAPVTTRTTTRSHRVNRATTRHATTAPRPSGTRSGRRSGSTGHSGPTATTATASPAATAATPAAPAHRAPGHSVLARAHAKNNVAQHTTGFASLNRAADRVIQVIPGAVLLALVGLAALVALLMVRAWLTDRRRMRVLQQSYSVTVEALATAIEAKDHTTGGHIERVRSLGLLLAQQVAPRDTRDPQMAYGFLLHDIGKLAVPDAILRAPGRLDEDEWALMRRHPEEGVRILSHIPFLDRALDVVRHHHERWDGGGYPNGLAGTEIPLWARIFSVVDALDAMTAERPYRARQPYDYALDEIRSNAGTQFDPDVVTALEGIDPAEVERLLEPAQVLDRAPAGDPVDVERLAEILSVTTPRVAA